MDSSIPFPLFSSLRVGGDVNGRPFIYPLRVPLRTTLPTAFSPLSEQQPAEIRPTSIEVAWPVTAGLGVRVLKSRRGREASSSRRTQAPLAFIKSVSSYIHTTPRNMGGN
ncbi:hypothetical protein AVEN_184233-1 [Araneus ventricosus]|uniref:Uncharacterized protein n=1 Tax=Araneus ventricosus TaxID=182803 RepID=A0A4Y2SN69_ARAVE|nr:hypothetical protein AVEN_3506-1 [Araneus ventricosus]GBN90142.1 hypothetical protein AVEN_184233-1 [Araneus ventricosus]